MHTQPTQSKSETTGERLLRLPEVEARVGLGKSAIYRRMKAGTFPACIKTGPRAVAWPLSNIDNWMAPKNRFDSRPEEEKWYALANLIGLQAFRRLLVTPEFIEFEGRRYWCR